MSNFAREGKNANAALLVTLEPDDFPDQSVLGGMLWQQEIEAAAFRAGPGSAHPGPGHAPAPAATLPQAAAAAADSAARTAASGHVLPAATTAGPGSTCKVVNLTLTLICDKVH